MKGKEESHLNSALLDPGVLEESAPEQTGARLRGVVRVGRYEIAESIAAGGMATVHLGRLLGAGGFSRLVAIKRLHPQFAADPEFEAMFMDEARLAARIAHPNVVSVLDVVSDAGELLLVMDYVHGESLWRLMSEARKTGVQIPLPVAVMVGANALRGLHAAHQATDRRGKPLGIVHRDVSPHNIVVGKDGVPRVLDFGIAKAADSLCMTEAGTVRGKMAYMAPEQLVGKSLCRRTDIFAMGIVLWELLTGDRLFKQGVRPELMNGFKGRLEGPRSRRAEVSPELDAVVLRALASERDERFVDCQQMADALESTLAAAPASEVAGWVSSLAGEALARRAEVAANVECRGLSARPRPPAYPPASGARRQRRVGPPLPPPPPINTGRQPRKPPPPPARAASASPENHPSHPPAVPSQARGRITGGTDQSAVSLRAGGPSVSGAPTALSALPSGAVPPPSSVAPSAPGAEAPLVGAAAAARVEQEATSAPIRQPGARLPASKKLAAVAAALCLAIGVLWLALGGEPEDTATAEEPRAEASQTVEAPPVKAEAPPEEHHAESDVKLKAEERVEPKVPDRPKAPTVKKSYRPSPKAKPRTRQAKSRPKKSNKSSCSPPYTVDSKGRKHFKTACFK